MLEKQFGFDPDQLKVLKGGVDAWQQAGHPVEAGIARIKRVVELGYGVTLDGIPENAKKVSIWIPIPRSNSVQRIRGLRVSDRVPYTILMEKEYNNRFLHLELSEKQMESSKFLFTVFYLVQREYFKRHGPNNDANLEADASLKRFLTPNSFVPIDGKIAQEASSVVGTVEDPSRQAKLLFDHIVDTIDYDESGAGWGAGDAIHAQNVRTGNCTDFHSLFIGEARSLGIPARFIMGFAIPPENQLGMVRGYHCWSEFYIDGEGWIPVDASEAKKHLAERWKYFGNLDVNRVSFILGRDIRIPGAQDNSVKNYVIYPYAEADGKEIPIEWRMSFKEL